MYGRGVIQLVCAVLLFVGHANADNILKVNLDAAVREYCHVLRFPEGWRMPKFLPNGDGTLRVVPAFDLSGDSEFRVVGLLGTKFLVRGVEAFGDKDYTPNIYEVDLYNPKAVAQLAREETWNSAAAIPLTRGAFGADVQIPNRNPKYVEFHGRRFASAGENWAGTLISLDRAVLVLQSWSGTLGPSGGSDVPGDFPISLKFGRAHGKLFFDGYNTDTGKKLITVTASFGTVLPDEVFGKTGWVTERYFIVPLDERRERCLICDFGRTRFKCATGIMPPVASRALAKS